jgi:molybdopterin synthase sulfur carrier subunit
MVRVELPYHLRQLAGVGREVAIEVPGEVVTIGALIAALEARFPMLRGTIRDHQSGERRPLLRFFACEEDLSFSPPSSALPEAVVRGAEPFIILGAIAGGSR